ncbi:MAG: HYR domain-containing protein, partial [Bacteroidota bacterium]
MSSTITCVPYSKTPFHNSFGKASLWVVFIFSLFFSTWGVVGQNPTYAHLEERQMENINVTFADVFNIEQKVNRVIISVDVNPQGDIFVLTFGNGIKKVGPSGQLIDFIENSGGRLNSPMDFAINNEGKFYVAVNSGSNKSIRVFSPTGVFLISENIGTGDFGTGPNNFKGPLGVAFDVYDNLYVTDHYTGSETNVIQPSRIKIYTKGPTGSYVNRLLTEFYQVEGEEFFFTYRIAADSQGNIYVAEQGNSSGNARIQVIKLDNNNIPRRIAIIGGVGDQIGSPGSLYVDEYDFLYAADFGNEVKMTTILEAGNDPFKLFEIFEPVKRGIQNNVFKINIYKDFVYTGAITEKIDFPIDLAMDSCGKLNVNNAILSGTTGSPPFYFGLNATMDFDLEIYKRTPSFDLTNPLLVCPADIEVTAASGATSAIVNYIPPTPTDNCSTPVLTSDGPVSGSNFPLGTTIITYTATDDAGNIATCSFKITVNPAEE